MEALIMSVMSKPEAFQSLICTNWMFPVCNMQYGIYRHTLCMEILHSTAIRHATATGQPGNYLYGRAIVGSLAEASTWVRPRAYPEAAGKGNLL